MLLGGLGLGLAVVRRRSAAPEPEALTAEERGQLDRILGR
jgi:hypothetical protein